MTSSNMVCLALVSALMLGGAAWKTVEKSSPQQVTDPAQTSRFDAVFAEAGLEPAGTRKVTDEKVFTLKGYRRPDCPAGGLLVLPLLRNAEGALLLNHVTDDNSLVPTYVLNGTRYENFPGFSFWWQRATHRIARLSGEKAPVPMVLAIAELGNCQIASQIDWKSVSGALGTPLAPLSSQANDEKGGRNDA